MSTAEKKLTRKTEPETRPADYRPQPGDKAALSLSDFSDDNLFGELRRRGYNGQLRIIKTIRL